MKFLSKNELIEIDVEDDALFISRASSFKVLPVDGPGHNRKARERQKAGSEMALPLLSIFLVEIDRTNLGFQPVFYVEAF